MNSMVNKVRLIGHLGQAPEVIKFESGTKVARLNIATSEPYKDKIGQWVSNLQWHTAFAWGSLAEKIEKSLEKGSEIIIEGRLVNKIFETQTGQKQFITEIEISDYLLLNSKFEKS